MGESMQVVGRANTVFVFSSKKAAITVIVVRVIKQPAGGKRLCFCGSVKFSISVKKHIRDIILPIIDRIVDTLGLARQNFEISAVNLGAASAQGVGVTVSGFSADLPIILAILSATLQITISNDFVSTGHIASVDGDISAVEAITEKVKAAQNDGAIKEFIYGDIEKDKSFGELSPNQRDRSIEAIMAARDSLRARAVSNIVQLVRLVFTEESIVIASLREGFFDFSQATGQFNDYVKGVVGFLTCNNKKRFWDILDYYLLSGHCEKAGQLLVAFGQFYIRGRKYPKGFGARLFQLFRSIPPAVRTLKIDFPIMDQGLCNELITLAGNDDYNDIPLLLDAVHGRNMVVTGPINIQPKIKASGFDGIVFDTIVSQINEQALARKFGTIDSARACFILESIKVKSYEELIDILQAYYTHLRRYIGFSPEKPDISEVRSEAIKLLERTFYNKGGDKIAFAWARDGTEGGIRTILDRCTEQYKADKQDAYVNRVFKDAISDMNFCQRIECMQAIINEVGRFLPEEIKNQPPERFARSDETIEMVIRTYVTCSNKFNKSLNSM